jgi:MATE family multidrug resistance protein
MSDVRRSAERGDDAHERHATRAATERVKVELAALLRLTWPIALSEMGLMAMGLVDTAVLGRVSASDLAASAIARSVAFTAIMPAFGVTMALEPLASQAVGAREEKRAWLALLDTMKVVSLAWLPLALASLGSLLLLERLGIEPEVARRARIYGLIQAPGLLFALVFLAAKTFLQAHGKTRPTLVASALANAVNLVLCNVLARGDGALAAVGLRPMGLPARGVAGAALAFSIAQALMAILVCAAAWLHRPRQGEAAPRVGARTILRLGVPVGSQLLVEAGVFCFATVLAGRFGASAESAHQIALGLASFTFMGAVGVSGATAVRVGYAVGEGRSPRRAGLLGIGVAAAYMLLCALGFLVAKGPLTEAFTTEPAVLELGAQLLVVVAFFQLFDGVQAVTAGALRGAGDVRFPFFANVAAHWLVGLPCGLLLGFVAGWGVRGIWCGLAVGLVCAAGLLFARFLRVSRGVVERV